MLKKGIKKLLSVYGYELYQPRYSDPNLPIAKNEGYDLFQYKNSNGTFDYNKYKEVQVAGNKGKIGSVWAKKENIEFLAKYIKNQCKQTNFGLCHGTRRGEEQKWFREALDCEVIGTEISDTATQFPHTIEWDFHEVKQEWLDSVDFIYSNSLDHSYDPEKCLNAWMSCISDGGVCLLEHTSGHETATELDPFGVSVEYLPYLILNWGKGSYSVKEILSPPTTPAGMKHIHYLAIQKH